MLSYRLGTANDFHCGFTPDLCLSKPHSVSTCFEYISYNDNVYLRMCFKNTLSILQC